MNEVVYRSTQLLPGLGMHNKSRLPCRCNAPHIADLISFSVAAFHLQYVDLVIMLIYLQRAHPALKLMTKTQVCTPYRILVVMLNLAYKFANDGATSWWVRPCLRRFGISDVEIFQTEMRLLELLRWDLAVTKEHFDATCAGLCYDMSVYRSWPATGTIWATASYDSKVNHQIYKPLDGSRYRKTECHGVTRHQRPNAILSNNAVGWSSTRAGRDRSQVGERRR